MVTEPPNGFSNFAVPMKTDVFSFCSLGADTICCDNHQHVQHVRHLQRTDVTFDDIGNIMNGNRN